MKTNRILIAILVVAAALRFIGTKPGYNKYHADEGISYSGAVHMIRNNSFEPERYDYPALVPLSNYIFFKFLFIPLKWSQYYLTNIPEILEGIIHIPIAPLEKQRLFQDFVLGERDINSLFWGRYVTALFSLANVFLLYLLSKKIFNKNVGIIAAFLLAFNYKHVINSHIGLPDIYNAFYLLLSLLASYGIIKKPSFRNYFFSGITVGLSMSVKYQVFALFPFLLSHIFASFDKNSLKFFKNIFSTQFIAGALFVPLTFAIINPYFFIKFGEVYEIVSWVSKKYAMGKNSLNLYPLWYFFNIDYGPIEFILTILGFIYAFFRYPKKILFLLSYLFPFLFVMLYYSKGGFYVRNFITITPLLFIFTAVLIQKLSKVFTKHILIILLPLTIFVPAKNAIINSYHYTKPWGYDLMRPWVQNNLPMDKTIAVHPFDASNLGVTATTTEFELSGNYSLAEHKEAGAQYAIMNLNFAGNPFYFWMIYGPSELEYFWKKPMDMMRNTYYGIAAEELIKYQIHSVSKPWQAPDTHIVIAKIPHWPDIQLNSITNYNFDQNNQDWRISNKYGIKDQYPIYDTVTKSLVFNYTGARYPGIRIYSPPIPIKNNRLYKITAKLKTATNLLSHKRDGFIRADFYSSNSDFEKVGILSTVSSRAYGSGDWQEKIITARAPDNAKYLTISFSAESNQVWLDDVEILESINEINDITKNSPYNYQNLDLNYIYPNSHGNL